TSTPAFEVDAPPPLRFGAPDARAGDEATYRAPRAPRLRAIRGAMLLAVVCLALIAVTWTAWTPVLEGVADAASTLAGREGDGRAQVTATVGLAAVAVFGFVVSWSRVTHPRRAVRLSDDRGTMAVDAIAGQLRASILELDEI